jgi:hypothetical protein
MGLNFPIESFANSGFSVLDDFLSAAECREIVAALDGLVTRNEVVRVTPATASNSSFMTANGDQLASRVPRLSTLYQEISDLLGKRGIGSNQMLTNREIGLSANITPPGGKFTFHYDRHEMTAVLYLNDVQQGDLICHPRHRLLISPRSQGVPRKFQSLADRIMRNKAMRKPGIKVTPRPGRLVVFEGLTCLHGVEEVQGSTPRYSVQFGYDSVPTRFDLGNTKDYYGYKK